MKSLTRSLSLLTLASLVLFFANCGGDGGEQVSPEKAQLQKLSKTWTIVSATLDGGTPTPDKTSDYAGFTLTISGTYNANNTTEFPYQYTTTNRPALSPWEASGNWKFGANPNSQIVRDDGLGITYTLPSDGTLKLEYTFSGYGYSSSKVAVVEGKWTLVLR